MAAAENVNAQVAGAGLGSNTDVRAGIDEMVRRIVRRFAPERIVLFGSHARGGAGPDSDVDLLVIMDVKGSRRETRVRIRIELGDLDLPTDILVATPDEVRTYGHLIGSILRPALCEGRVLYERPA
jgi:predicted nucleotidyltransferase